MDSTTPTNQSTQMQATDSPELIAAKAATRAAANYFVEMFKTTAQSGIVPKDVSLEEIEHDRKNKQWLVTIGYNEVNIDSNNVFAALYPNTQKTMKLLTIDDTSFDVISMKNR